MTLTTFYCKQCCRTLPICSRPKNAFEHFASRLHLTQYYRCRYCGERYATIGLGKSRLVFHKKDLGVVQATIVATLFAGTAIGLILLLAY
jgi:hypothetical protein